jgi:lantibiotic modifying enzyme
MTPERAPGGGAFLDAAAAIGARLCRDAVWDGARCNWLGDMLEPLGGAWTVVHRAMGPTLYDGTAGIALFLARLHALAGGRPFRAAAEGALRQAVSRAGTIDPAARIGLHSGLTGIAWALAAAGEALGEGALLDESRRLARGLLEVEPSPGATDVISGSAGAVPVLLELAGRLGEPELRGAAVRHGEMLLDAANRGEAGWSWRTLDMPTRQDLTGYSHGASGIALALLELFRATGEERFREGAEQGFRYERGCFVPAQGNWPDFRLFGDPAAAAAQPVGCSLAWCHGAPGIGLARLRALRLTGDPVHRGEAGAALAVTAQALRMAAATGSAGFSLCHGDAGNAELLLLAAEALGEPEHRAVAEELGRRGIERHLAPGVPWPCGVLNAGETPGLMLGLAGIGYFYLRLHAPARAPSVLLISPGEAE